MPKYEYFISNAVCDMTPSPATIFCIFVSRMELM